MAIYEYRKCKACGEYRHDLMFPWKHADGALHATPPRSDSERALRAYETRLRDAYDRRQAAQRLGRDYDRCIPCVNGDT
jgi:hypothetical protein